MRHCGGGQALHFTATGLQTLISCASPAGREGGGSEGRTTQVRRGHILSLSLSLIGIAWHPVSSRGSLTVSPPSHLRLLKSMLSALCCILSFSPAGWNGLVRVLTPCILDWTILYLYIAFLIEYLLVLKGPAACSMTSFRQ